MATVEANIGAGRTRPSPDWLRAFVASQSKGARSLASSVRREDRLRFSRTVTFHVIAAYCRNIRASRVGAGRFATCPASRTFRPWRHLPNRWRKRSEVLWPSWMSRTPAT